MANTLVGSVIAIVSVAPARDSGTTWYFWAVSPGQQLDDRGIDLEGAEGDRGHAVLLAEQRGDLVILHEPQLDQVEAELPPVLALMFQRRLQLIVRDALLLEKQLTYSSGH